MKPNNFKWIGEDKAMVELHNKQPFDWEGWLRQQAANKMGIPVEEVPDPDNGAEHPDEQEKEERIYEED